MGNLDYLKCSKTVVNWRFANTWGWEDQEFLDSFSYQVMYFGIYVVLKVNSLDVLKRKYNYIIKKSGT